jgi:hypothetical protein
MYNFNTNFNRFNQVARFLELQSTAGNLPARAGGGGKTTLLGGHVVHGVHEAYCRCCEQCVPPVEGHGAADPLFLLVSAA